MLRSEVSREDAVQSLKLTMAVDWSRVSSAEEMLDLLASDEGLHQTYILGARLDRKLTEARDLSRAARAKSERARQFKEAISGRRRIERDRDV